jgi:flagellar assembly protein FliH
MNMAGVIKSGKLQDSGNAAHVAAFNFEDMAQKADSYIDAVRRRGAQMLVEAQQRATVIEEEARASGRLAAREDAERSAQAELARQLELLVPALTLAIEEIRAARENWLRHWEQNTVRLAIAIAARIIRREVAKTPEISIEWLREALELVTDEGRITVHLNPADFAVLGEHARCLTERISPRGVSQIVADAAIEPGGCRVETEFGRIDQQVSAQLARIEEELRVEI